MYLKSEGVIISKRNFGEADRLLTIYTRDFGKISCIAKGVRRPRSKKAGHLELGNWCKIFVARGKNIDLLTEVELKRAFGIANFTEAKANKIYHLLELINNLTADHQRNPRAFRLLVHFLSKAASVEEDFNLISSVFKIQLLSNLGFFSTGSLKDSKTKDILKILENEQYEVIKRKLKLSQTSSLKLLSFLDSMIENVGEHKLKTSRFLPNA